MSLTEHKQQHQQVQRKRWQKQPSSSSSSPHSYFFCAVLLLSIQCTFCFTASLIRPMQHPMCSSFQTGMIPSTTTCHDRNAQRDFPFLSARNRRRKLRVNECLYSSTGDDIDTSMAEEEEEEDYEDYDDYENDDVDLFNREEQQEKTLTKPKNKTDDDWLQKTTTHLLHNIPIGSYTKQNLRDAHAVVDAWAKTNSVEGAIQAEEILRRVVKEREAGGVVYPTFVMYTMTIDGWARSVGDEGSVGGGGKKEDAAKRAEQILRGMQEAYEDGDETVKPNVVTFNAVINAWAKCGHVGAPQQALRVLSWMNELRKSNKNDSKPNETSYNTILGAYARSGSADAPDKIAKILAYMDRMSSEGRQTELKPSTISYNSYLSALVNSAARGTRPSDASAHKAEEILYKMIKRCENGEDDVEPDGWTFTFVILAWAKSGLKNAASRAEEALRRMEAYQRENTLVWGDRPNDVAYNSNHFTTKPISIAYNSVIDAHAKSDVSGSARCAEDILMRMERMYESGENRDVKPDLVSYNSCINAYAKSRERGSAYKAEALFRHMEDLYKDGDLSVKPNVITYNAVLDCWAKSGGKKAAYQAEKLLNEMYENYQAGKSDVLPTTVTFNTVMYAHARSGDPQAGQRAEDILNQMDELYRDGNEDVKPDVISFTNVINAWSKSRNKMAGQRALAILHRMEELHDAGYSNNIQPNSFTINAVINALSKSREIGKARTAYDTLLRAKRKKVVGVSTNVRLYNSVLNACAFSDKRRDDPVDVMNIAMEVMKEVQEQNIASDITYSTYLRVLSTFMPQGEDRQRATEETFRLCCRDGLLSQGVLDQLRRAADEKLYSRLMKEGLLSGGGTGEIVVDWSRNVKYTRR